MSAELKVGDVVHWSNDFGTKSDHPLYNMCGKDLIVTEVKFDGIFTHFKIQGVPNPFSLDKMWVFIPPFVKVISISASPNIIDKKWYYGYS